jgi:hypothetical protein
MVLADDVEPWHGVYSGSGATKYGADGSEVTRAVIASTFAADGLWIEDSASLVLTVDDDLSGFWNRPDGSGSFTSDVCP